jgi:glycosyl transferase family 2
MAAAVPASGRIAILLSTFDGERFLREQLESFLAQTHADWVLYWRDDGSSDRTIAMMGDFARRLGAGRCVRAQGPEAPLGVTASYLGLLASALEVEPKPDAFAFADQDDVWLPDKLARGMAALADVPLGMPTLYCARQILVDERLRRLGLSPSIAEEPGFPAALAQNIATGCTIMVNPAAARLLARSRPPAGTLHDWWSYLLVAAAGGRILADAAPAVLYRQHAGNQVGAPAWLPGRMAAALRRGPAPFMRRFRANVAALQAQSHLLSAEARADLDAIARGMNGGVLGRARVLGMRGLHRRTSLETFLFRCWFMLG